MFSTTSLTALAAAFLLSTALPAAPAPQPALVIPGGAGDCQINGPLSICEIVPGNYASLFPGTNYAWSLPINTAGAFFCSPNGLQNICVNTAHSGTFTLRLDYVLNSGPKNCSISVTVNPSLSIADLTGQTACVGDDVVLQTSVLAGNGPYTFDWTLDQGAGPVAIAGAHSDTLLLTDVSDANEGTYCVNVTGQCGSAQSCAALTVDVCGGGGDEFCTLTQGAYGSAGGTFNGASTIDLLNHLLTTNLTVGKPGRSLTIQAGNGSCVITRLPGVTTAATLPAIGDALLDTGTCQTSPTALPLKNGKFKNVLLGQTVTLALNTRLDPNLPALGVCETMVTQLMNAGLDGLFGTPDDQPDPGMDGIFGTADDVTTVNISAHVIDALATLGLPITAGGILELANRALAAQSTGAATLSEVSGAAEAINRGFDNCRTLLDCH